MTQELKPCPECKTTLDPAYSNGRNTQDDPGDRLVYYRHPANDGCLFRNFLLWPQYVPQWNAMPRQSETKWIKITPDTFSQWSSFEEPDVVVGAYDKYGAWKTEYARWSVLYQGWTESDTGNVGISITPTHYIRQFLMPLPNPPEVTNSANPAR